MIPQLNFSFLTPLAPRTGYPLLGGWGWGGCRGGGGGCCVCIWTQVTGNFFLAHGPPNPWRGPRVRTPGTPGSPPPPPLWALASEDLAVFMLDKAI